MSEGVSLLFKFLRRIALLDASVGSLLYSPSLATLITLVLQLTA